MLTPRLVCRRAADAIRFYCDVMGAEELERHVDGEKGEHIVHAGLRLFGHPFSITEEAPHWHNHSPEALGGTPVILAVDVPDPDKLGAAMTTAGAKVIFEIKDHGYGRYEGRLKDPFGHFWIIGRDC